MNIEEEKAIENLKDFVYKDGWVQVGKAKIVLKLIEKQQAEIENLKEEEMLDKADIEEIFRLRKENEKKDKVIDEMAKEIDRLSDEMQRYDEDRAILECCTQSNMCNADIYIECKECIKEYFYKKVSDNK